MILSTILASIFSIYPWNMSVTGYATSGQYSDEGSSFSQAGYISMDRRSKDGFVLAYEDLTIEKDGETYRQFNWMGRDAFWIKPSLRFVGIVGHLESPSENESLIGSDDAWLAGGRIEGDLKWFGYSTGFIRSDYQIWFPWSLREDVWYNLLIDQFDLQLSRKIGPVVMRIGLTQEKIDDKNYTTNSMLVSGRFREKCTASFSFSQGESLYAVDPYLLIINNNAEILNQTMALRGTYKVSPNFYISGVWTQHKYVPFDIRYLSIGLTGRF
ncbi:MAG: hypothetical protein HOB40_01855 [Candidatus Marinimicrobia bacterium]|jgi:hypothetical protein|nr:hypothetical protein [Candidatus Neomarinimicrobiota bacterium]MBT3838556.1 hypothetical protein [Candidatus Neomarinimicrobiota bacterium]MBT4067929.1 hypothetical protein [Candidatus Neomarinimicrobiota bacterium]MBT4283441.1 hypothetical protein [Candidatus Neomarinimicrobiota bacterium]MBT4635906.1 hypothetical protein [Candidatus Neomarinimicrobiota bacterium]